ncbi:17276_t:CDS:2 [Dentiscutata erythropus]|uniref:17276_t:CDS:1 n=1 Tax=Dentiscutata erythropus TaxID=1348616 RepID=A0A9N9IAR3_9GLOM|nr:17276_t:CDS:2 [Dentiscutata erythropus]
MESTFYFNFVKYLTTLELPPNLTLKKQQQFKKQATHYIVKNNQLYRKLKGSLQKLLYVIQESELLTQLQVHIDLIMNKLQQVQLKAQQNIEIAQQKQKEKHDKCVKEILFHIGDKVLLYRSAQAKIHGDKFQ